MEGEGGSPTSVQGGLFKSPSTESLSSGEWQVLNEAMVLQQINLSLDQEVPRSNSIDSGRSSSVTDDNFSSTPTQNGFSERLGYLKASRDVVNEEIDLNLHVKAAVLTRCQHGKTQEYCIPNQIDVLLDLKKRTPSECLNVNITLSMHPLLKLYVDHQATIKNADGLELSDIRSELKELFGTDVPRVFEFRNMVLEAFNDLLSKDFSFNDERRLDQYNIANPSTHNVEYRKVLFELVKLHKRLFPECMKKLSSEY